MTLHTQSIAYQDTGTQLTGQFVWDDTRDHRRPGILVIHGGAGLDDHAKGRAKQLAQLGFVVFACDMYGDGVAGNRERIMSRIAELRADPAILGRRAQAGLRVLASHPQVDGRFAAVGYCFGGMTVLELARSGANIAGVVSVHGSLNTSRPAPPGLLKAKILVCHGALDPHVPMPRVTAFLDEMNHSAADYQLIIYAGAQHGFTHDSGPTLPGVAYDALSDSRSRAAIHSFLLELFPPN
jgi:dienelactone hydrolase